MLDFKEITIDDKQVFDEYFALMQYDISEFTFTNLFMWRTPYKIRYAIQDGLLCIAGNDESGFPFYFMPAGRGDLDKVLNELLKTGFYKTRPFFKSLSGRMVEELELARPGVFDFKPNPSLFDYVYSSSDLINLKGKKYHSKRNHINKFMSLYSYNYIPFDASMADECVRIIIEWHSRGYCEGLHIPEIEKDAILDMLENCETLKFKGGVIKVDGKIVALTFGEKLNSNTAVIHVEKADTDYDGAYTMINQKFCEHEWIGMEFINREEDMDIEGLRKAKRSYHPVCMVEKFDAYVK